MTTPATGFTRGRLCALLLALVVIATAGGCIHRPQILPAKKQIAIDRRFVEYPSGYVLIPLVNDLNSPTAIAFDEEQNMLVAESGGPEPHIFGFHRDGKYFNVYPYNRNVSFYPTGFVMYGPISGMVARNGKIYVAHRDRDDKGVITALGYDGSHTTIVANLPAQGDYGLTDLVFNPQDGRLWFGVGTATNSGVVGVDNFEAGWLKQHPDAHDLFYSAGNPPGDIVLNGYRFDSRNPWAGLFGGADVARTGPGQPFGVSDQARLRPSDTPNGAIYSVAADGGDRRVEAFGIHNPRGIAFNAYGTAYFTNDGMQLRGSRPIKDDRDSLLKVSKGSGYGWPDYTTDLQPVSEPEFQPPLELRTHGYSYNSFLIDHTASGLRVPDPSVVVVGKFTPMSGAAKMDVVPEKGPFSQFFHSAIVALDGDRAPFATSGSKEFMGPVGYKVSRVDLDTKQVKDFIRNTTGTPASMQPYGTVALERPIDVKFGPDGALYILDFGRMENKNGIPRLFPGTGQILKLVPTSPVATAPATAADGTP